MLFAHAYLGLIYSWGQRAANFYKDDWASGVNTRIPLALTTKHFWHHNDTRYKGFIPYYEDGGGSNNLLDVAVRAWDQVYQAWRTPTHSVTGVKSGGPRAKRYYLFPTHTQGEKLEIAFTKTSDDNYYVQFEGLAYAI